MESEEYKNTDGDFDDEASEEFEELDQISRVALLIDDLNNEDPLAQQNSIEKLGTIVQVLGKHRTVDELIPMLTELIDKIDSNSELLMHLAQELGNLTDFLGSDFCIELCKPLELICAADENMVRDKAQKSLLKVCDLLEKPSTRTEFYEIVERLSKGDLYSMRIASCYLLAKTYTKTYNSEVRDKLFKDLSGDDTPMVRRAIAINLGEFAEAIKYPIDIVLESYKSLLDDQQDAVKIESLKNSCILAKLIQQDSSLSQVEKDKKLEDEILIPVVKASENKKSWRLRFSVAELLDELTHIIGKELADKHIKPMVEALISDTEPEVKSEILLKVIEIMEFVKPDLILDKIIALTTDTSQHVRESLAECICKIASHVDTELYVSKALPGMCQLMKDATTEVRVCVLENIETVTQVIGQENIDALIIPALLELTTDKQWRVRYGIAQFFPKLAKIFGKELYIEKMEKVSLDFLSDNVFQIREQSMKNLVDLKITLGEDWFERTAKEKVREFSRSEKCSIRIQSIFLVRIIHDHIDPDILNKDIIPVIIGLKDDSVPNIKFNISKTLDELSGLLSRENIFIGKSALTSLCENDSDEDVKYFSKKALSNEVFSI
ncbi:unnamed protein product [Moneuplotes crassus]|uniref:Phosphatase PP2A regulatory subunit A/Splicing factor 3B subunit 1-like HEAT repeat domain-containing protein n=1 Tax=Euplotes crassus TaxID=5936 RepID=A0AAD1X6M0_EUPCR|nr:unnamed protein product [Moneuplotes crassus]